MLMVLHNDTLLTQIITQPAKVVHVHLENSQQNCQEGFE